MCSTTPRSSPSLQKNTLERAGNERDSSGQTAIYREAFLGQVFIYKFITDIKFMHNLLKLYETLQKAAVQGTPLRIPSVSDLRLHSLIFVRGIVTTLWHVRGWKLWL